MDGNGRWAENRGLKRVEGHKKGAEVVRDITIFCTKEEEINFLTLYAFSSENWKRPKIEVDFLMNLLDSYLKKELPTYLENSVKFNVIGDLSKLSNKLQNRIEKTKEATKNGTKLVQTLAINYGSQDEILRAVKKICETKTEITKENFEKFLDTFDLPPVDIMIRTGQEIRISNFLMWQIAYAELFFSKTLFPDFNANELSDILEEFKQRERRFGGI